jgi:hypothetical protein
MKDFFEELKHETEDVKIDIKELVNHDWKEFRNELGLSPAATSKRIIIEMGNLLKEPDNKFKAFMALLKLNNDDENQDEKLTDYLINGVFSLIGLSLIEDEGTQKIDQIIKMGDLTLGEISKKLNIG